MSGRQRPQAASPQRHLGAACSNDVDALRYASDPPRSFGVYDRDIVLPPVFLARADASCTARAHDFTPLGLKEFLALAAVLDFFVLSDVPDNAAPNLRYQAWLVTQLPRNIFFYFAGCAVHTAHRIVAGAVQEKRLVGDAYSIHFIIVQPKIYSILLRALRSNPRQPKHDVHNSQSSKVVKIINS